MTSESFLGDEYFVVTLMIGRFFVLERNIARQGNCKQPAEICPAQVDSAGRNHVNWGKKVGIDNDADSTFSSSDLHEAAAPA
jgi:hypothetical protein